MFNDFKSGWSPEEAGESLEILDKKTFFSSEKKYEWWIRKVAARTKASVEW